MGGGGEQDPGVPSTLLTAAPISSLQVPASSLYFFIPFSSSPHFWC